MSNASDDLPDVLRSIRTQPLLVLRLSVRPLQIVGATPGAFRRVGVIYGGTFEGERLSGEVLEGGSDWQTVRTDRATTLDVRLILKTDDGALISMTYRGIRHGPQEVRACPIFRGMVKSYTTLGCRAGCPAFFRRPPWIGF
jgi:hypothetical protein